MQANNRPDLREPHGEPVRDGGPAEAAHFVAEAIRDLAALARRHRLDTLGFLLDMALLEAEERSRGDIV